MGVWSEGKDVGNNIQGLLDGNKGRGESERGATMTNRFPEGSRWDFFGFGITLFVETSS
jgi:hypothetical protein